MTWAIRGAPSLSALRYDVRTRTADWNLARKTLVVGPATRCGPASARARRPSPRPRHHVAATSRSRSAHATSPATPVLVAWVTSEASTDDRAMTRVSGSWAREPSTGSYRGTTSSSTQRGATLRATVAGSRVYVVGSRCRACGVMRVSVDGGPSVAVDTRASTTQRRVLLYSRPVAAGVHTVSVSTAATTGRPRVYLDAVGAGL